MGFVPVVRAAELLGISDDTLYRRAKAGTVKCRRDILGRLQIDIPGQPDTLEPEAPETSMIPPAGGFITEAVHLHNILQERTEHLRTLEIEAGHLRALNLELLAMLRKAVRAPRQTRRLRTMLSIPPS